jgi:ribosomal protein L32
VQALEKKKLDDEACGEIETAHPGCPNCSQLIREYQYLSMSIIGGTRWTDGYSEGPMVINIPGLVKCPTCNKVFWISDAEEIGEYDYIGLQFGW